MPRFNPLQNAFVSGELSPWLEGRDDIRQYAQGMRQSVNQLVLPQGAVIHRSGTHFESETKGSGPVVLRPFEVGLDQAYILEMGDEYMRFHANEGQLAIATVVNAVNFDGSTTVHGTLSGLANTNKLMVSLWFNILGGDGAAMILYRQRAFQIARFADNKLAAATLSGNQVFLKTSEQFTTSINPGWHNIICSIDFDTLRAQLYIDGAAPSLDVDLIDLVNFPPPIDIFSGVSADDTVGVGGYGGDSINPPGLSPFIGDMAEVYGNYSKSLDLSDILNRRKFIDAAGKPVGLGLPGDNPTGNPAIVLLSGATMDWHTNKGTGLGLTELGTLTTASTSPSD